MAGSWKRLSTSPGPLTLIFTTSTVFPIRISCGSNIYTELFNCETFLFRRDLIPTLLRKRAVTWPFFRNDPTPNCDLRDTENFHNIIYCPKENCNYSFAASCVPLARPVLNNLIQPVSETRLTGSTMTSMLS